MSICPKEDREVITTNRGDVYVFESEYPDENPPNAVKDIVDCLAHIGMFDGIKRN